VPDRPRPPQSPRTLARRGALAGAAPAVLLAVLLLATLTATILAAARVHDRGQEVLADRARTATDAIGRRMETYAQILRGTAGLYRASDDVTPEDFERFLSGQELGERYPGVAGVVHAQALAPEQVPAFERATTRAVAGSGLDYPPRLRVHPAPTPGTQRLLVVDRLSPASRQSVAFGLDVLTDPDRGPAARRAAATGRPAASAPLRLFRQQGSSLGVVLFVPVRQAGSGALDGVVYAAFRMDQLLRGALGPPDPDVRLEIFDVGPTTTAPDSRRIAPDATAFDLRAGGRAPRSDREDTRIETVDVAGRRWAVSYMQTSSTLSASERVVPWVIAIAGILVSLLAAALLRSIAGARARAVRLAETMTVELRERELQLQRSNEELEHFAYLASHDLQEPLRTIRSYVDLLEQRAAAGLDDRARSWLGFVGEGAERMSHLIADLLEYSRTGRSHGPAQDADLNAAWDLAVANLERSIGEAGATVTRDELPVVRARPGELTSLLQNLIANGLKYRGEAAPNVHASAHADDGRWEITVTDNGIGIDPRFHDRVFGLFQRLHTAEEYPGTGMGLAIVKKIAESNGGNVRVESRAGEGSTFVVTLPGREHA
jgi:signal transduction histidine kinase